MTTIETSRLANQTESSTSVDDDMTSIWSSVLLYPVAELSLLLNGSGDIIWTAGAEAAYGSEVFEIGMRHLAYHRL